MQTPAEKISELQNRVYQLEIEKVAAVSAAYGSMVAALESLRDNRVIQNIHLKLAKEAMEQSLKESLATHPSLLDAIRYGHWPEPFHKG